MKILNRMNKLQSKCLNLYSSKEMYGEMQMRILKHMVISPKQSFSMNKEILEHIDMIGKREICAHLRNESCNI